MNVQLSLATDSVHQPRWEHIEARDAQLDLLHDALPSSTAAMLFEALLNTVVWRHDQIKIAGNKFALPRLQQLYGEQGKSYTWAGIHMDPQPWSAAPSVLMLRTLVEHVTTLRWNAVLVNLYRDGSDSVAWHSDDETLLGQTPTIASLSLGAQRDFLMRRYDSQERICIRLPHNSLLLMAGTTQQYWQHSLPKRKNIREPRINLTFRNLE